VRRRRGRGFEYLDPDGGRVDDPEVLERIAELVIPPAWREVWVCMDPLGHLQATGVDAAGRKQYLYHERWRAHRDRRKFDSMIAFSAALPRLRRRVARDLQLPSGERQVAVGQLTEQRVLALAVRLLDLGFFRIGSEDYAERNESYGLTTMLREHVTVDGLRAAMRTAGYDAPEAETWAKLVDGLLTQTLEPTLIQPTILLDYPLVLSPFAKRTPDDPDTVERFEAFAGGMEIANAFTELNDPDDQAERFVMQQAERAAGDDEAQPMDEDFLVALEHGMPPTGGLGLGIDRLVMLLTGASSIREVVLFPALRT